MKALQQIGILVLVVLTITCSQSVEASARGTKAIAVLPFENSSGLEKLEPLKEGLRDLITADLSKVKGITVVERENLERIIKEQKLSLEGLVEKKNQIKVGKLVGANVMLAGGFSLSDSKLKINAHLLDVETTQLVNSEEVTGEVSKIIDLQRQLVLKLVKDLDLKIELPAPGEIDIAPEVNLHFIRGLGYYYGCMYDHAIMEFMNTMNLDPEYVDAIYWRAQSYMEQEEYDHAKIELEKLTKTFSDHQLVPRCKKLLKECQDKEKMLKE